MNPSSGSGGRPLTVGLVARIFNNMPVWAAQRRAPLSESGLSVKAEILYGVSAVDPFTFTAVTLLLALVAIMASYIPARRAVRTSPIKAFRCE